MLGSRFQHLKSFKTGFLLGFSTMLLIPKTLYFKMAETYYDIIEIDDIQWNQLNNENDSFVYKTSFHPSELIFFTRSTVFGAARLIFWSPFIMLSFYLSIPFLTKSLGFSFISGFLGFFSTFLIRSWVLSWVGSKRWIMKLFYYLCLTSLSMKRFCSGITSPNSFKRFSCSPLASLYLNLEVVSSTSSICFFEIFFKLRSSLNRSVILNRSSWKDYWSFRSF